jgi:hypothetical protein
MAKMAFSLHSLTSPAWAGDPLDSMSLIPGGAQLNAALFPFEDVQTVTANGAATAAATTLTVDALTVAIPAGARLFGASIVTVAIAAAIGATTLTTLPLPANVADNATFTFPGSNRKPVVSGTLIGRTFAERAAGTGFGPAVVASDDEIYLLAFDVPDADFDPSCELYRHESLVKENFLPQWGSFTNEEKAKVRALYQSILGVA